MRSQFCVNQALGQSPPEEAPDGGRSKPVPPEVRAALVQALADALVAAWRREQQHGGHEN
jgi:hypothetical protein